MAPTTQTPEQLAQEPLFEGVAGASLGKMLADSQELELAAGDLLCQQGDLSTDFFLILSGQVAVNVDQEDGSSLRVSRVDAHSGVGEMSALSCAPRSATLTALVPTRVLSVPQHAFRILYADKRAAPFKERLDDRYRERALASHLGQARLFRGLDRRALDGLAKASDLTVVEEGEVVFREGDEGDAFYLVRSGHFKITHIGPDGREMLLGYSAENAFFGELALVRDQPRKGTVTAMTRSDLVRIPKASFTALLEKWPRIKERVDRHLADLDRGYDAASEEEMGLMVHGGLGKAGEALVIDMNRCTHCNMCVNACIEAHDDRTPRISKRGIPFEGGSMLLASSCYNCTTPDCMLSCRFGAILRRVDGLVVIDPQACTGCKKCEKACPYGAIQMQTSIPLGGGGLASMIARLPVVGRLFARKPPADGSGASAPEGKGRAVARKALAVKCDLCASRGDMACIYYCPYSAIERINPQELVR